MSADRPTRKQPDTEDAEQLERLRANYERHHRHAVETGTSLRPTEQHVDAALALLSSEVAGCGDSNCIYCAAVMTLMAAISVQEPRGGAP